MARPPTASEPASVRPRRSIAWSAPPPPRQRTTRPVPEQKHEATPTGRTPPIGGIEFVDHRHVLGWAWYSPTPDEPIEVEILVDDAVVRTVFADLSRPDLRAAGVGDGRHGFLWTISNVS